MCRMQIEDGIIIDAVEKVVAEIEELNGMRIKDHEVIKKFVLEECATKFYIDEKLNSYMEPTGSALYVWLDSGFVDSFGAPILIALHKGYAGYEGHITGTSKKLINDMKSRHAKHKRHISDNASRFLNKYNSKVGERKVQHITDIEKYYLDSCNGSEEIFGVHMADKLQAITSELIANGTFTEEDFKEMPEIAASEKVQLEENDEKSDKKFEQMQQEITVGMLMDHIDELHKEIDRLVEIIEGCKKDKEYIEELHEREDNLKRVIADIRMFENEQKVEMEQREFERFDETLVGHNLLESNKKVLVLGDAVIGLKELYGIAKTFGFEKKDIEYQTDYEKITNDAGRLQQSNRYAAVILGAMPHKVSKLGCWDSLAAKFATEGFGPICVEAHNNAGRLIINKESYKRALKEVMGKLKVVDSVV